MQFLENFWYLYVRFLGFNPNTKFGLIPGFQIQQARPRLFCGDDAIWVDWWEMSRRNLVDPPRGYPSDKGGWKWPNPCSVVVGFLWFSRQFMRGDNNMPSGKLLAWSSFVFILVPWTRLKARIDMLGWQQLFWNYFNWTSWIIQKRCTIDDLLYQQNHQTLVHPIHRHSSFLHFREWQNAKLFNHKLSTWGNQVFTRLDTTQHIPKCQDTFWRSLDLRGAEY